MKSAIYMLIFSFCFSSVASAFTLDDMSGVYDLSTKSKINFLGPGMTIEYKLAIDKSKDEFGHNIIGVNEYIKQVVGTSPAVTITELKCWGTAELTPDKVIMADLTCPNQRSFEQEINLSKIKKNDDGTFSAPVYTSLYNTKIDMNFKKASILKK